MQNSFPEIPLFWLGKTAVSGFDHRIHDLLGGILRDMQLFCCISPHRKAVQQMLQNCDFLLLQRAFCAFVYVERGNRGVVYALGQFTRNYTQTTKRGLLTTNKG